MTTYEEYLKKSDPETQECYRNRTGLNLTPTRAEVAKAGGEDSSENRYIEDGGSVAVIKGNVGWGCPEEKIDYERDKRLFID